jgi:hypothetical protein
VAGSRATGSRHHNLVLQKKKKHIGGQGRRSYPSTSSTPFLSAASPPFGVRTKTLYDRLERVFASLHNAAFNCRSSPNFVSAHNKAFESYYNAGVSQPSFPLDPIQFRSSTCFFLPFRVRKAQASSGCVCFAAAYIHRVFREMRTA